jgi:sec-independent protein translocase protein TatC
MARALKRPEIKNRLPRKLPSLPRLPDPNEPDVFDEMTLLEHMEELRDRIVKSSIAVGLAFIIGLFLANPLLSTLREKANAENGLDILSPTEPITVFMKIALYIAVGITMPVLVWQLIGFLAPGLTRKEKRMLFSSLPFVSILFLSGAAFSFFFAAPRAFDFLSRWQSDIFEWSPQGSEIISFYLQLMIGMGLAFQLPVVMFLLAALNIVSAKRMASFRKYAILVVMIAAAVITPTPDPFNMMFVAVPIYLLYEVGIIIARVFIRRKNTTK